MQDMMLSDELMQSEELTDRTIRDLMTDLRARVAELDDGSLEWRIVHALYRLVPIGEASDLMTQEIFWTVAAALYPLMAAPSDLRAFIDHEAHTADARRVLRSLIELIHGEEVLTDAN